MAGPYYLRSTDGSDASDGLSWANAKATLAGVAAVIAAGERCWVSQAHAETQASAMTLTVAGTAAAPVQILCGNDAAEPPTALATGASVTTTGASNMTFDGFAVVGDEQAASGGIIFNCGDGSGTLSMTIGAGNPFGWQFHACALAVLGTGSAAKMNWGNAAASGNKDLALTLTNTTVRLPANAAASLVLRWMRLRMRGGAFITTSTPTTVMALTASAVTNARFRGVDLSLFASGKTLLNVGVATPSVVSYENCKLGALSAVVTGTNPGPGGPIVLLDNCDSADTQYRMHRHSYEGDVYSEATIVRTSGASDGTTALSHKMVSSASRTFTTSLYGPDLTRWFPGTAAEIADWTPGASKTVTVEIVHDSVTALTDAEVWLEVEYLGTSGFPLSLFASDRAASIIATPADQTASTVGWTTTGITNVNKQKLVATIAPQEMGWIRARVAVAKASYTLYADPLLTIA